MRHVIADRAMLRTVAASCLVVVIAAAVIWMNRDAARTVSTHAEALVSQQLPELTLISSLQSALNERVIQLYRYYATMDPGHWQQGRAAQARFERLRRELLALGPPPVAEVELERPLAGLQGAEAAFHAEMASGSGRDWDELRAHLARAQGDAGELRAALAGWSDAIRSRARRGAQATMSQILRLEGLQFTFALGAGVVALFIIGMLSARSRDRAELYRSAYFDPLTQLPNTRRLEKDCAMAEAAGARLPETLLLVSLDRFRLITRTFGHAFGERLVHALALRLQEVLEQWAGQARLHQSSRAAWLITVDEGEHHRLSATIAARLLALSQESLACGDRQMNIACSVGIAHRAGAAMTVEELIRQADASLQLAQSRGGNQICAFEPSMQERTQRWLATEGALREALRGGDFELHFQPQVCARDGRCVGAEALLRWRREGELVSPALFIPVAEESGLIIELGDWVLSETLRQWRAWADAGPPPPRVAVNVSAQQFQRPDFASQVAGALARHRVPGARLELEITEEATAGEAEAVIDTMRALKGLGVSLAMDDFGMGYSSLANLKRFPLDVLKIDRSFVTGLERSARDRAIVKMINTLAGELHCQVVAEGVETEGQAQCLRALGCDLLQGFLFSAPLEPQVYAGYLSRTPQSRLWATEAGDRRGAIERRSA